MFHSLLKRAVLLSGLVLAGSVPAWAGDAVLNGGFEDVSLDPFTWTAPGSSPAGLFVTTSDSHSGAQSAYMDNPVNGTAQAVNKYQEDLFIAGKTLHAQAWVKVTTDPGSQVQTWLAVNQKIGPTGTTNTEGPRINGALPSWTRLDCLHTVTNDARADLSTPITHGDNNYFLGLRIISFSPGASTGASRTYIDDLTLEEYTANPQDRLNNPGFELGLISWQVFPLARTVDPVNDEVHGGSTSARVTLAPGTDATLYQVYNGPDFFINSDLYFSAWVKASFASAGGGVYLTRDTMINNAFGNDFNTVTSLLGNQPTWVKLAGNFILAAGPAQGDPLGDPNDALYLRLYSDALTVTGGPSEIWWDDVEFWPSSVPVELSAFGLD